MTNWADTEAIWKSMSGSAPLYEIYGHWSTMHDAVIRNMNFDFADRALEVVFDYDDAVAGKDEKKDVKTRITLLWRGITESKLRLYDGDLYGMNLAWVNGFIETRFEEYAWGLDGFICSASLELRHFEPSPDMSGIAVGDVAYREIHISLI